MNIQNIIFFKFKFKFNFSPWLKTLTSVIVATKLFCYFLRIKDLLPWLAEIKYNYDYKLNI